MGNPFLGVFFHWLGGLASGILALILSTIIIGIGTWLKGHMGGH